MKPNKQTVCLFVWLHIYWFVSMHIKFSNFSKSMRLVWFHHSHRDQFDKKWTTLFGINESLTCWVKAPVLPVPCHIALPAYMTALLQLWSCLTYSSESSLSPRSSSQTPACISVLGRWAGGTQLHLAYSEYVETFIWVTCICEFWFSFEQLG